ncbi:hypothetical protein P171DRAFT_490991 [Karstenula rhodostoma CBS 690.94]|uniref:C2H2-type domain-containing protein n=1 Tax=Karstenula rhodostoma CBS 690.94 TaxID=1392251 RepID=A0A9P4U6N5_9PLEO|nr:hypothetical protein P171DRAFT_490991 [Karstenula rhodostoma CBS 690.94]
MDQPRSLTTLFGYDEDEWIDRSCQLYPAGANASDWETNQVAGDDRCYSIIEDTVWPGLGGTRDFLHLLNDNSSSNMDNATLRQPGTVFGHLIATKNQDAMSDGVGKNLQTVEDISLTDGQRKSSFQFVSGSVVVKDNSDSKNKKRSTKPDTGIRCEHPGCSYLGTFNRKYDLQRHMTKHSNLQKGKCPLEFCERHFDRYDKLREHLRKAHADTEEAICPNSQCNMRVPFMLLDYHVNIHYSSSTTVVEKACGGRLSDLRSCPIASCEYNTKKLLIEELQEHIRQHTTKDRDKSSGAILAAGYDPANGNVICPVCKTRFCAMEDFYFHLQNEHIFKNGYYAQNIAETWHMIWHITRYVLWRTEPVSGEVARLFRVQPEAHISQLRPHHEYAQHRLAILRLWPDFHEHPLFDEFTKASVS